MIVVINAAFGTLYVLTKAKEFRLVLWLNLVEFLMCAANGIYLLIMAAMMLNAVNTINRITQRNSKDPNNRLIVLHLIMIFFSFTGVCTMWTLFAAAWYSDYRKEDTVTRSSRDTRATGVLIGNVCLFIATLVLLYVFWGYGLSPGQQGISKTTTTNQ